MYATVKKIYIIGAGPGDPELLTLKAAKILSQADVVVVDRLVSVEILQTHVNPEAKIISVGKQGNCHASTTQTEINALLLSLQKEFRCVVRLKGGDTAFFSNMLDELGIFRQHGIPYEIIPGITAASGASAYTGIPLTARGYATGVQFLSCCSHLKMSESEWESAAQMKNTLVWYMVSREWPHIAQKLVKAGADLKTPMVIIEQASTPQQYVHQFFLDDFLNEKNEHPWLSPSIIIVGKVAALYKQFSWLYNPSERVAYFQSLS